MVNRDTAYQVMAAVITPEYHTIYASKHLLANLAKSCITESTLTEQSDVNSSGRLHRLAIGPCRYISKTVSHLPHTCLYLPELSDNASKQYKIKQMVMAQTCMIDYGLAALNIVM